METRTEMNDAEIAMRKFLKQLGVTAHQELGNALSKAVSDEKVTPGVKLKVTARVEIAYLDFVHEVAADLVAPE
tara:strand:+ start:108 stop:329 length:222 start_codon:yes stop_codon:yes gene_type:complete